MWFFSSLPSTVGQSLEAVVSVHSGKSYELVSSAAETVLVSIN